MNASSIQRLIRSLEAVAAVIGPDATARQILSLLHVAQAGSAGIDGITLQKRADLSQAAASRTFKLLGPHLGLCEAFLDQNDGRMRLQRLTTKGTRQVAKIIDPLS